MRNHTIEIGDREGRSFKMAISTVRAAGDLLDAYAGNLVFPTVRETGTDATLSFNAVAVGSWRTIDKGALRFNSGQIYPAKSGEDHTTQNLYLLNLDGTWGMQIFDYQDYWGVNDEGKGFVIQPWIMNFSEGKFSWSLVD